MLSKQHYTEIAHILRSHKEKRKSHEERYRQWIATDLADYFVTDNPRFDRHRFLEAAGVSSCTKG